MAFSSAAQSIVEASFHKACCPERGCREYYIDGVNAVLAYRGVWGWWDFWLLFFFFGSDCVNSLIRNVGGRESGIRDGLAIEWRVSISI